jgi:hypothetical protein
MEALPEPTMTPSLTSHLLLSRLFALAFISQPERVLPSNRETNPSSATAEQAKASKAVKESVQLRRTIAMTFQGAGRGVMMRDEGGSADKRQISRR